jgi:hypothetical protein
MKCVRLMVGDSLIDKIRSHVLIKRIGTRPALEYHRELKQKLFGYKSVQKKNCHSQIQKTNKNN